MMARQMAPGAKGEIPMNRHRRLRRLAVAAFLLAGVGCVALYARFIARDVPLPEDSDLVLPPRIKIPDEENGFAQLVAIAEAMPDFDYGWLDRFREHPLYDPASESLDLRSAQESTWAGSALRERALELFAETDEAFEAVDRVLTLEHWQQPEFSPDDSLDRSNALGRVIDHSTWLRCDILLMEGRGRDALGEAVRLIAVGRQVRRSAATLGVFMQGLRFEINGLKLIRKVCRHDRSSATREADFTAALRRLPTTESLERDLARAVRRDYSDARDRILHEGADLSFKPHRTLAELADHTRRFIETLRRPLLEQEPRSTRRGLIERSTAAITGNSVGSALADLSNFDREGTLKITTKFRWQLDATRLLLALEIHRLRHDSLPPTLEALVPAILPAVPRDPYDGKPLRYDPVRGVIWSIGEDGVDSGGLEQSDFSVFDADEPTLWLLRPPH